MYTYAVYENTVFGPPRILTILNRYVSEMFVIGPSEELEVGLRTDQEGLLLSANVKKAILEAEKRKAETLDMIRLREISR